MCIFQLVWKIVGKAKLDTSEVLISKSLIDWCISHDEFVSGNNEIKEIKILKLLWNILYKSNCVSSKKVLEKLNKID